MFSVAPKFGAVYLHQSDFKKLPELDLDDKILNRPENTTVDQTAATNAFVTKGRSEFGFRVGVTNRRDGIIIVTDDDGPSGKEPASRDVFTSGDQQRLTNYLDRYGAGYREGQFAHLKKTT